MPQVMVQAMMVQVTQNQAGTAFATANSSVAGVEIAGKTGTAQNGINNTKPVSGTGAKAILNSHFSSIFIRTLYDVVRTAKTKDSIPAYLEQFLGAKSLFCTNNALVKDYGFLADPSCGS